MSDDLKPCPFCTEGKSVSTYFYHEQGDKWGYAACDACESRGPEVRTGYYRADDAPWRAEAIAAWNTRTPDPSIEALTAKVKLMDDLDVINGEKIEALTAERDEHWKSFVHWRKEADALTEQLEAARADAKEAEAYAEELEVMNKNQKVMIRQADDRGDAWRFRADIAEVKLAECEARLGKAVEGQKIKALEQILEERGAVFDAMVDAAEDAAGKDVSFNVVVGRALRAAIAEIKGESHE